MSAPTYSPGPGELWALIIAVGILIGIVLAAVDTYQARKRNRKGDDDGSTA